MSNLQSERFPRDHDCNWYKAPEITLRRAIITGAPDKSNSFLFKQCKNFCELILQPRMTRISLPTKHANHTNFQRTTADYTDSTDLGAHTARVSVSAVCRNTLISNCAEVPPSREPTTPFHEILATD